LVLNDLFIEETFGDFFLEDRFFLFSFLHDGSIVLFLFDIFHEFTLHQGLIFGGNLFGRNTIHAICVISDTDQQGAQEDGYVETVTLLQPGHIGRGGNALRKLVWGIEFLILNELAKSLSTFLVVIKFQEA
jgi:hypothetical protein